MNWIKKHKVLTVIAVIIILVIAKGVAGGNKTNTGNGSGAQANTLNKTEPAATTETKQPAVPAEYISALSQAGSYANTMHMSKQGVYDQLVSQNGGQFPAAAAKYAIDNVKANWDANALAKAKDYQKTMSLSSAAIHDQLTSDSGEKFTQAEADYAIQHLSD